VQAWVGQLVGPGHLDLANAATRGKILDAASSLLAEGFVGIHYDFEPVPDGDTGLLRLLADSHTVTRKSGAALSVSVDQIEPFPGLHTPEQWVFGSPHWWSTGFLRQVAERVDAVAVMTYNTAVPLEPAYSGYIRQQTQLALDAVPSTVEVLMGLPAYHSGDVGHGTTETVAAGIRGVRLALSSRPVQPQHFGVALYVDFAATESDWQTYRDDWCRGR
jgi:spore germination protein YaaH